ncbi:hypothetical protein HIM_07446 [Hirsutella minnesotensis 3608]|uniref:non-specific serine/threonine protein kinase n=1 Tax=Hirsutella minnesotensis 3608 TaxID=1043627 RepID=A0A0F8A4A7_9HYPO|nr:hypothetical protein HIM_07446 [Hirsutella minnesotensis 3608]
MASYGHHQMASQPQPGHRHAPPRVAYGQPTMAAPGIAAPPGTFSPGTKIQVGSHRVVIQKYLSEGGFAHVYLVKMPKPVDDTDLAVLKRVAVPDKDALRNMRTEVETMKRLKGHRPIVTYIDSHASELRGGGYEVFLLMEYCDGGGLIDFMNTRLQHRLTEPEIIAIFADIAEGVACMHYLKPPLLHRDLKVENVLITARGASKRFKLCDFGSAAPPRPAPTTVIECRLMDEDVQKHTTLQYRSPEMIDVYRKQPLNEKSDIWALGVLLYKLCYYTTPFEDQGQLAILNASYRYPSQPVFSDRLKKLIASMLRESMEARPNIFQVLKEACAMQGREMPVKDIYTGRSQSDTRRNDDVRADPMPKPQVGATFSAPVKEQQHIPEVVPMRRGRPTPSHGTTNVPERSASPTKRVSEGDPFAALDTRNGQPIETDELSARFPTLDQFALLHDQGAKFDFDSGATPSSATLPTIEKLADATFTSAQPCPADPVPSSNLRSVPSSAPERASLSSLERPTSGSPSAAQSVEQSKARAIISSNPDLKAITSQNTSKYVSTGTMTTPERFPRRPEQGQPPRVAGSNIVPSQNPPTLGRRPSLSSRPSLEDSRNLALRTGPAESLNQVHGRPRPASTTFESSTVEFLREKESWKTQSRPSRPLSRGSQPRSSSNLNIAARPEESKETTSASGILIDVDDGSDVSLNPDADKRLSVSSASVPRNMLAGKFGDAFKRFESSKTPDPEAGGPTQPPSKESVSHVLTPIAGSEATDGRSDDGLVNLQDEELSPEKRREMERLQLQEEEERVAAAKAEHRRRVANDGSNSRPVPGPKRVGVAKAASIQSRVQSLLDEEQRPTQIQRTAEGYGKYTDAARSVSRGDKDKASPTVPRKPLGVPKSKFNPTGSKAESMTSPTERLSGSPAQATIVSKPTGSRPAAPRKPVHLNNIPTGARPPSPAKRSNAMPSEVQMAADLPGQPVLQMSSQEKDDYINDFAKRFPSLTSMEMEAAMRGDRAVGR